MSTMVIGLRGLSLDTGLVFWETLFSVCAFFLFAPGLMIPLLGDMKENFDGFEGAVILTGDVDISLVLFRLFSSFALSAADNSA